MVISPFVGNVGGRCLTGFMVAEQLSLTPGYRLGRGSVLDDLAEIDAGIDRGLLTRAEVLLEWVEENEVPAEPDAFGPGRFAERPSPDGFSAGFDELGERRVARDQDGLLPARAVVIAGPGAPLVSDMALVDLAATLRRSVVSASRLVGGITELAYRLPRIWDRCRGGGVTLWRALRVAEKTSSVPWPVATQVDGELVSVLGSCSWAQVDRCVQAALARHEEHQDIATSEDETPAGDDDPAASEDDPAGSEEGTGGPDASADQAEDARDVQINLGDAGTDPHLHGAAAIGLTGITGTLEDADALDLEAAIRELAATLAAAGSRESLGARRAKALGMLARGEVPLPTGDHAPGTSRAAPAPAGSRRHVLLVLHLTDTALLGGDRVGRCQNTLAPVSVDQIKEWCAGAKVRIQPVLDVAAHHPVGTYEIPDRLRAQVHYRDVECVFPHCHTPARACDLDHITPYPDGPTCGCNLAPLCRRHHRAKTARRWTYLMLHPGTYYWRAPSGRTYLVDAHGTHQLPDLAVPGVADRHRRPCPGDTSAPAAPARGATGATSTAGTASSSTRTSTRARRRRRRPRRPIRPPTPLPPEAQPPPEPDPPDLGPPPF